MTEYQNEVFELVDWGRAPDWANWWAVDSDGWAWWYDDKPKPHFEEGMWFMAERGIATASAGFVSLYNFDIIWTETLMYRPAPTPEPAVSVFRQDGIYTEDDVLKLKRMAIERDPFSAIEEQGGSVESVQSFYWRLTSAQAQIVAALAHRAKNGRYLAPMDFVDAHREVLTDDEQSVFLRS